VKDTGSIAIAVIATALFTAACSSHRDTTSSATSPDGSAPRESSVPQAAIASQLPAGSAQQARLDWMKRKPSSWDTAPSGGTANSAGASTASSASATQGESEVAE
jgi:hypothetical protein